MSAFIKPFSSVNPFDQSKEWYIGKLSWKQTENDEKEQAMPVQSEGHQGRRNAQNT